MCHFFSALVLKNGDVLSHPLVDSHSTLVSYFQLPDGHAHHQHFAKVELTPGGWADVSTWNFRLDEDTVPGWWSDIETQAEATARSRAAESRGTHEHNDRAIIAALVGRIASNLKTSRDWLTTLAPLAERADYGRIYPRFFHDLLTAEQGGVQAQVRRYPKIAGGVAGVSALYARWIETGTKPSVTEWREARSAADAAAYAAADAAAYAAADAAAYAAAAAGHREYQRQADVLLRLFQEGQ